jgi:hypothetical protein
MSFYKFEQNNSGGSFVMNDKLAHRVYIEADTLEQAEEKAFGLGIYYFGVYNGYDCSCCGDRWYKPEFITFPRQWDEQRAFYNVEAYSEYLKDKYGWGPIEYHIYYADGTKKTGRKE